MKAKFNHCNINVTNLEKSIQFYQAALGLKEMNRKESDGFTLVYLGDGETPFKLELTCLKDHPQSYDLGENESHICFTVEDYEESYQHHKKMDCICFENDAMGIYFINDPDDYWLEIVPAKRG